MSGDFIIPLSLDDESQPAFGGREQALCVEEELEQFRRQWRQELHEQQSQDSDHVQHQGAAQQKSGSQGGPSIEEQAKYLFLQGVNAEQSGRLYQAIRYYRRAVQLVPDIEFRIEELQPRRRERYESESSVEMTSDVNEEEEEDGDYLGDLVTRFQKKLKLQQVGVCQPAIEDKGTHISALPVELLVYIFKWVVSEDVDVVSLEHLAQVCLGFYLCSRDEELWRLICHRVWGRNCGRPSSYGSYRNMYIQRPHLKYNGCYISKASYYRQGEKGLDNFCRPYHLVEYYRYVRFFPEGQMLMMTTPDDPHLALGSLKQRGGRVEGMLHGYYRMSGDQGLFPNEININGPAMWIITRIRKFDRFRILYPVRHISVTAVLRRRKPSEFTTLTSYQKYWRRRNNQNENDADQAFHVAFLVKNVGKRCHCQLVWNHYSVHTLYKSTGEETVADFELTKKTYPHLMFSPVRSYTAVTHSPLR